MIDDHDRLSERKGIRTCANSPSGLCSGTSANRQPVRHPETHVHLESSHLNGDGGPGLD